MLESTFPTSLGKSINTMLPMLMLLMFSSQTFKVLLSETVALTGTTMILVLILRWATGTHFMGTIYVISLKLHNATGQVVVPLMLHSNVESSSWNSIDSRAMSMFITSMVLAGVLQRILPSIKAREKV